MRNHYLFILAALIVSACSPKNPDNSEASNSSASTLPSDQLKKLDWFVGSWQMSRHDTITRETWKQLPDGSFAGTGVTFTPKDTLFKEKLQLLLVHDTIVYRAFPGGAAKGTDFRLARISETEAVFENPVNDFPKRIQYWHPVPDSLHARISGPIEGKEMSEDFRMVRVR